MLLGLLLKRSNQRLPFKAYTYSPIKSFQTPVDWSLLSSFHVEGEHIRIHDLTDGGENLREAVEGYHKAHAKAVIIINTADTSRLSDELIDLLEVFDKCLVAVLSSTDGSSLYEALDDDDVYAR